MDSLVEDLLRELECPICMEYQVPPILQCTNGHNICNSCKPSLQNCPSCRGGFMDIRCRLMENLSNRITHPCKYKNSGCTGHFLLDFKKQHENECLYSPHKCPFVISSACTWVGALVQIKKHIISSHCLKNLDGQMYFVSKQNGITRDAIYIFDEVFFFYAKSLGNLVQMMIIFVGFEEEAKRYKYKITIQTPDGVQSMSACLTCSSYIRFTENQPTFTDDVCAIFPSTFFCNMINKESRVPVNLEIFKSPPEE